MKAFLTGIKDLARNFWQSKKGRNRTGWGLAIFLMLQLYFVRELIAAELIFGIFVAFMFALAVFFYFVGTIGVNGQDWAEAGARVAVSSARRGFSTIEEISKRPFRHPHSESAQ